MPQHLIKTSWMRHAATPLSKTSRDIFLMFECLSMQATLGKICNRSSKNHKESSKLTRYIVMLKLISILLMARCQYHAPPQIVETGFGRDKHPFAIKN